jgi:hypothetical protein
MDRIIGALRTGGLDEPAQGATAMGITVIGGFDHNIGFIVGGTLFRRMRPRSQQRSGKLGATDRVGVGGLREHSRNDRHRNNSSVHLIPHQAMGFCGEATAEVAQWLDEAAIYDGEVGREAIAVALVQCVFPDPTGKSLGKPRRRVWQTVQRWPKFMLFTQRGTDRCAAHRPTERQERREDQASPSLPRALVEFLRPF